MKIILSQTKRLYVNYTFVTQNVIVKFRLPPPYSSPKYSNNKLINILITAVLIIQDIINDNSEQ